MTAHEVNVEGTLNLLEFAQHEAESHGRPVVFLYPSSIAAYGLPGVEAKRQAGRVREDEWTHPTTMYGCNKLYCEQLGAVLRASLQAARGRAHSGRVDFRAVRFPGLISAVTVPSGGTSDYAPEMIHAAAKGEPYACFVRPDTRIPFMAMPDGVDALLDAGRRRRGAACTQTAYNLGAFAPTADDVRAGSAARVSRTPTSPIKSTPSGRASSIAGRKTSTTRRRAATGASAPQYDFETAFREYLIPEIKKRYGSER